jgi:hypothetical protein
VTNTLHERKRLSQGEASVAKRLICPLDRVVGHERELRTVCITRETISVCATDRAEG